MPEGETSARSCFSGVSVFARSHREHAARDAGRRDRRAPVSRVLRERPLPVALRGRLVRTGRATAWNRAPRRELPLDGRADEETGVPSPIPPMNPSVTYRSAGPAGSLRTTLEMIKFSHTIFALPFALLSAVLAAGGWPDAATLAKIVLAMVGARSAAMAHNRLADRRLDAANPRTASRALPAGALSVGYVRVFLAASVAVFLLAAASLNRLTLLLAPVALAILFLYSYTKRFTALCHLVLGLCLAMAPVGAWIAVRGDIRAPAVYLGLAVLFWTAGFDVIYALQDEAHDRRVGIHSIPERLGTRQ